MKGLRKYGYVDSRGERPRSLQEINRTALATALGVSRSHISRVLSGSAKPSVAMMRRLAEVAGVTLDEVDRWLKTRQG